MDSLHAIYLGIIEGITEFLPISSTGHLILASKIFHLPETEFLKSFEIIIQTGAILSVIVLYWRRFLLERAVLLRVAVAFLPTGILGLLLYKYIKIWLGSENVVVWSLLLGGIALIAFERWHSQEREIHTNIAELSYKQVFLVGCFQSLAMIPGVSRSGATILGGLWLGFERTMIVEFSFLLAVPTMLAATGLDVLKNYHSFVGANLGILATGFLVSFVVAWLSIQWLLKFVKTHTFTGFGMYRILVALIFLFFLM
jgi:undecaprenyl-diphosphatase